MLVGESREGGPVDFRVLGPLEAAEHGELLDLGPHKQRSLLALLLMHPNRVVTTDRILDELWGDAADGKENALWVYVSRLRAVLEPERGPHDRPRVLVTSDRGYLLAVGPDAIDAARFEAAAADGRSLLRSDPAAASERLRAGLDMWRGSAWQDFAYEDFAQMEITRLEELRVTALGDRIEGDLRCGQASELVGEIEALHAEHPLRERFVGQLMLALYRSGRQAEALRAFERFRRHLAEELALEPSPELRRLEEQVLLHDSRIQAPRSARRRPGVGAVTQVNPYKGLRPFAEDDGADFFGCDRVVTDVIRRLEGGGGLVALVGPSGSGKSSVVHAGVIPALRKGAVTGSADWLIAQMVPGSHPFAELEAALLRSSLDAPDSFGGLLADAETGLLRAALRLLPSPEGRVVLVIDQLEELFTLVENEAERRRFLANLVVALDDPHGRISVIVTLRADFYERPLVYPEFGARLGDGVVNVVPLLPDQLEQAARLPAEHAGVSFEPTLLAALLTDVVGRPGTLPLFQFTLTELFDRRVGDTLTLDAYRAMNGVLGAVTGRAEDLYCGLPPGQQEAARQLFLRLVALGDGDAWGRRRVPAAEVIALEIDVIDLRAVIDLFTSHRLLTLDRDAVTAAPTVEVAHEALLTEWDRLRKWIEQGREDIRRHGALASMISEWESAGRDSDYLLSGSRLEVYEQWAATATMELTAVERTYIESAVADREASREAERERLGLEAKTARSARRRLWGLAATLLALAAVGAALLIAALAPSPPAVAVVYEGRELSHWGGLVADGIDRVRRDFDITVEEVTPPFTDLEASYRHLAESGADLVIGIATVAGPVGLVAPDHPDTSWAVVENFFGGPGVTSVSFASEEGAFLVGVAAALSSETGTIGFVGGFQLEQTELMRAGYEAGARAANPAIRILAGYASGRIEEAFHRDDLVRAAATEQYQQGADVVFHAAGAAGVGVFQAARDHTDVLGRHVWAIGVDSDQYLDVDPLLRPHVLTSMVKKVDVAVYALVEGFMAGELEPTVQVLTLADGALDFSTQGDHLGEDVVRRVDEFKQGVASGSIAVPSVPTGALAAPPGIDTHTTATVTYDGGECTFDGPLRPEPGDVIRFDFVNTSAAEAWLVPVSPSAIGPAMIPARAGAGNSGYVTMMADATYTLWCTPVLGDTSAAAVAASLNVSGG